MVLMKEHDIFLDVVLRLQQNKRHDMLDLFFIICWTCWYRRNMKMFENKAMSIDAILGNALAMQKSYKELKNKPISIIRNQYKWELPPPGVFKLNVDGAFSSSGSVAGIGAIVRDSKGEVIMSAAKKECSAMIVVEVEALAIIRGLQFCIHLGISNLVIESDSQLVVTEFNQQGPSKATFGNVIREAKDLMSRFSICDVQHTYRNCNVAAHLLAKYGLSVQNVSLWWGAYPGVISNVLWYDSNTL
ncbi:uncharacterized protein LOC122312694 [Carya illinoinensis]|uniref:uncharacterized protein LOC122312694 n=1 Tax=Carya illinoinensis TaxID=32201 RepID=UPI001C7251F6|nr:uncharacterized protein LOC122312694 [Carya illinoinensis]